MPDRKKAQRDPIPKSFAALEAAAEFWDTHDLGDYWDQTKPVKNMKFEIEKRQHVIRLQPPLNQHPTPLAGVGKGS